MFNNIRVRFIILLVLLGAGLIIFMRNETDRVNSVTDMYLESIVRNSWFVGCAQGTNGDFKKCHEMSERMDWTRLAFDIKEIK